SRARRDGVRPVRRPSRGRRAAGGRAIASPARILLPRLAPHPTGTRGSEAAGRSGQVKAAGLSAPSALARVAVGCVLSRADRDLHAQEGVEFLWEGESRPATG